MVILYWCLQRDGCNNEEGGDINVDIIAYPLPFTAWKDWNYSLM